MRVHGPVCDGDGDGGHWGYGSPDASAVRDMRSSGPCREAMQGPLHRGGAGRGMGSADKPCRRLQPASGGARDLCPMLAARL